jgi:LysM repeat protein
LGRHSKPPRIRLPQATAGAAGTTVAGVAAAICLSPQAPAAASVVPSASAHHATVPPAYQRGPTPAQLLAVAKHATAHKAGSGDRTWYTVRHGDTLSSISARYLGTSRRWQGLWSANRKVIGGNPDKVRVGETLRLANDGLTAGEWHHLRHLARVASQYQARHARPATTTTVEPTQSAPATSSAPSASTSTWSGAYPGGSFGACVVARESGGNSQVMNSTGHYGLYQFSASTWAAYGGNPADFGHASVAEQNQVFANALAQGGQSNWSPYDGC